MKIGVISDTHDNIPKIKEAIDIFNHEKVDLVIHLGDYIAPFSLKPFDKLACNWIGIFGNNDGEKKGLKIASKGRIKNSPLNLEINPSTGIIKSLKPSRKLKMGSQISKNRKIIAVHDLLKLPKNTKGDLILFGHSHGPEIRRKNKLLILNPGECGGWLTHTSSIAIVDLETLEPRIIRL